MNINRLVRTNTSSGFTLVELIAVMAVIALLASVVFVSASAARSNARDKARAADVEMLRGAVRLYAEANESYPSALSDIGTVPLGPTDENEYYYSSQQVCTDGMETTNFVATPGDTYCK